MPVATTTPLPLPYVTVPVEYAMLILSPSAAFSPTTAAASLSTGTDSPVSAASSIFRDAELISLRSAGTTSPASSRTMSPRTSSSVGITFLSPPRITFAYGLLLLFSASRAFSALLSCTSPMMAFSMTMRSIIPLSISSEYSFLTMAIIAETAADTSKTIIIGSTNCDKSLSMNGFFFAPSRAFLPSLARMSAASSSVSPCGDECVSFRATSKSLSKYCIKPPL